MQPILKIDLSTGNSVAYKIPQEWERAFLGGASLAARLLYPYLTKELDPFLPEAPLLFLNGPLSGTSGPTVGRFVVCGKGQPQAYGLSQIAEASGDRNFVLPVTMVYG